MNIEFVQGDAADSLLADPAFRGQWAALMSACPWATAFQGEAFVGVWYRTYRGRYEPLLVLSRGADGSLAGMLALATELKGRRLVVAGSHHAEYHAWICGADQQDAFPKAAFTALRGRIPSGGLKFRYLPPATPTDWLESAEGRRICLMKAHPRPLLRFGDGGDIRKSMSKSGNKSRLKRLEKLGAVECKRIIDPADFDASFDEIIRCYDTRRLAVNGSAPFHNDPLKRPFHVEMVKESGLLHVTFLKVGDQIASAQLNTCGRGKEVHLSLIAHSPFFARHSPGKLHILLLAKMLLEEGIEQMDLTAGGDSYKERFANDWDEVHTLTVFPAAHARQTARIVGGAIDGAKALLKRYDLTPAQAINLTHRVKWLHPAHLPEMARRGSRALRRSGREMRVYRFDGASTMDLNGDGAKFCRNALEDLMAYRQVGMAPTRHEFVSAALRRIEEEQHAYTRVEAGQLLHCGWLVERPSEEMMASALPGFALPANSAMVADFQTFPSARRRGWGAMALRTMVRDALRVPRTEQVFVAVPADCAAACGLVEKVGFMFERSVIQTAPPAEVGKGPAAEDASPRAKGLQKPPVVILGGEANALSVARDLGRMGVAVYAMGEADSCVRNSRHCRWIDVTPTGGAEKAWAAYLLGPESDHLKGAVVLSCSDAGLQVLIKHRAALQGKYVLDLSDTEAQMTVLDKLTTYKNARAAGVAVPSFWEIASREQLLAVREELVYPLLVKPRLSHIFEAKLGRKHITVSNFEELLTAYDGSCDAGTELLLMELIPGGDDHLCSYYTYIDDRGKPQFDFTKRIIRRFPAGMGTACYHITDWIPEIVEPSQKLLEHIGLRGLANIEYKRDDRDGKYKLIECNARFTASNCLVSASGFSLARFVYNRLTGAEQEPLKDYQVGMRLWDPVRDFWAYRELSKRGEITFLQWLGSVLHLQTFPFFWWSDPMPAVARAMKPLRKLFRKK